MSITLPSLCQVCARRRKLGPVEFTCDAYPRGIPREIHRDGTVDHRAAYPGDQGVTFELDEGISEEFVEYVLDIYDNPPVPR